MSRQGLKVACLYSYRPFSLGFCGPQSASLKNVITQFLLGEKVAEEKVENILREFVGAYPYYVLIAHKNNIKDVFDEKVVEAYWLGNRLLDKVKKEHLGLLIFAGFAAPGWMDLAQARKKADSLPEEVLAHHSFHTLYLGSITHTVEVKGKTIDLCRISWGEVKKINHDKILVEYKPLILKPKPRLGTKIEKEIFWEKNFVKNIKVGDFVSFHWGFVCEKLNKEKINNLEKYTLKNLKLYAKK